MAELTEDLSPSGDLLISWKLVVNFVQQVCWWTKFRFAYETLSASNFEIIVTGHYRSI
jgi:hypothetical protein